MAVAVALSACSQVQPIQRSRIPEPLPDGRWAVTDGFLQEQYELERALRFHLEQCQAERDGTATPTAHFCIRRHE